MFTSVTQIALVTFDVGVYFSNSWWFQTVTSVMRVQGDGIPRLGVKMIRSRWEWQYQWSDLATSSLLSDSNWHQASNSHSRHPHCHWPKRHPFIDIDSEIVFTKDGDENLLPIWILRRAASLTATALLTTIFGCSLHPQNVRCNLIVPDVIEYLLLSICTDSTFDNVC